MQLWYSLELMHIEPLVLEGAPEPLHEDVIQSPTLTVHAYLDFPLLQRRQEVMAGKLATLIRVEYIRLRLLQRTVQCVDAEIGIQCVGQLPADDVPAVPVNDGDQVHETLWQRTVGDICAPHLIGLGNVNTSQ